MTLSRKSPPEREPDEIKFVDLSAQRLRLGDRIERAIARVLEHGMFVLGPEVDELERRLAAFSGVRHVVSCSSGTDALLLALMAWDVGPGDAVFVPSFTFAATAEVVALLGATPVFCDVDEKTFSLDPSSLGPALRKTARAGLAPKGVIPVDLFGQPADYSTIDHIASEHGMWVLADAAQSLGAERSGTPVGTMAPATATSFYPSKPLGCYGDGGAVFTNDSDMAARLRSLRTHGEGTHRYEHVAVGINARLDTVQAAVLIEKLAIFPEEIVLRLRVAQRYEEALAEIVAVPRLGQDTTSAWAQYAIGIDHRDEVAAKLLAQGIPTAVHYPKPLHRQPAYRHHPAVADGRSVSDALSETLLCLPMHPYLSEHAQDRVIDAVRQAVRRPAATSS